MQKLLEVIDHIADTNRNLNYMSKCYFDSEIVDTLTYFEYLCEKRLIGIRARTDTEAYIILFAARIVIDQSYDIVQNLFNTCKNHLYTLDDYVKCITEWQKDYTVSEPWIFNGYLHVAALVGGRLPYITLESVRFSVRSIAENSR